MSSTYILYHSWLLKQFKIKYNFKMSHSKSIKTGEKNVSPMFSNQILYKPRFRFDAMELNATQRKHL